MAFRSINLILSKPQNIEFGKAMLDNLVFQIDDKPMIYELKITEKKDSLRVRQINLYWKWMGEAGEQLGYTPNELHSTFKDMFFTPKVFTNFKGNPQEEDKSITRLKVSEMSDYMGQCARQCEEMGVSLTYPEDLHWKVGE